MNTQKKILQLATMLTASIYAHSMQQSTIEREREREALAQKKQKGIAECIDSRCGALALQLFTE